VNRCAVLALGNVLMGDDGLGPAVVAWLRARHDIPDEVALLDLGTPGLALTTHLEPYHGMILVDAVRGPRAPGRLVVLRGTAAIAGCSAERSGAHESGVAHALAASALLGTEPGEVVLIGAVPDRLEPGTDLSPALLRAAPRVGAAVAAQLARWGIALRPRTGGDPGQRPWQAAHRRAGPCTR
jgi:hydrogenase maturation protease